MEEFVGKVAIITGGAQGIGKATARLFASDKAKVAVFDWKQDEGDKTLKELQALGADACFLQVDVSQAAEVQDAVADVVKRWGRIDVLFANAAVQVNKLAADITEQEWDRMHGVNLKGVFLCCKYVVPVMQKQRQGVIVINGSGQSITTSRTFAAYAATKAGVLGFMKGVALDYAADGIRANCVLPGSTDSGLMDEYLRQFPDMDAERERVAKGLPLGRLADPDDIARAVRFLASNESRYVTGTYLLVDGGGLA
jgi:NAD(P)-dependent dehydrogenase (short-subunit alcohol dehydrogenase family)